MLAAMFITIAPIAGWPAGTPGKSRRSSGREGARQELDRAALLAEAHDAEPEAHHAGQAERDLEGGLGHLERRRDHRRPDRGVAERKATSRGGEKADQEERGPDPVQHRGSALEDGERACEQALTAKAGEAAAGPSRLFGHGSNLSKQARDPAIGFADESSAADPATPFPRPFRARAAGGPVLMSRRLPSRLAPARRSRRHRRLRRQRIAHAHPPAPSISTSPAPSKRRCASTRGCCRSKNYAAR